MPKPSTRQPDPQAEGDGGARALGELPSLRLTLSLLVGGDATRRTGAILSHRIYFLFIFTKLIPPQNRLHIAYYY